jgi:hypothetical protein
VKFDRTGFHGLDRHAPRANRYFSLSCGNLVHRFDAIHDQIEQHLLQLNPIP